MTIKEYVEFKNKLACARIKLSKLYRMPRGQMSRKGSAGILYEVASSLEFLAHVTENPMRDEMGDTLFEMALGMIKSQRMLLSDS